MLVWLLGSFTLSNWGQVQISAPYIVIGLAIMIALSRALNVLQLDEEQASQLGLNVELVKALLVIGASLATAAAVSVSGLIGFVGLVVPHIVRLVWGPDHRLLIPMSAIVGGGFLVIADTIARTILLPNELPVGIITAFCGAPFFLWLLRKRKELFF
jgi:iron complex transport system permease protein